MLAIWNNLPKTFNKSRSDAVMVELLAITGNHKSRRDGVTLE